MFTNEDFITQYVYMFFTSQQIVSKTIYELENKLTKIKNENIKKNNFLDYQNCLIETYYSLQSFYQELTEQNKKFITDINQIQKQNKHLHKHSEKHSQYNKLVKDLNCVIQAINVNKSRVENLLIEIKSFIKPFIYNKSHCHINIETMSTDSSENL